MLNARQPDLPCHAVTVDVEDWHHVCGVTSALSDVKLSQRVCDTTGMALDLLRSCKTRGTFFMLGSVAADHPELVEAIAAEGHELASHGWSHRLVTELTPQEFADELEQTAALLESISGKRPIGFRAPRWSLSRELTPWAFEILAEQGYLYDSSLTPLALIGDPHGLRSPHRIQTAAGEFWEIPPLVTPTFLGNLPTGGGWGFRFFPFGMIRASLGRYGAEGMPGVLFVHPRELDPDGPRLEMGMLRSFVAYGPRRSAANRLRALMTEFTFTTLGELVSTWQTAS